jgi:hypothetical protein
MRDTNGSTITDIKAIYDHGLWTYEHGWMGYGHFNFTTLNYIRRFFEVEVVLLEEMKKSNEYPFMPLHKSPDSRLLKWVNSTWHFYCSWSDQGMMMYYFFMLTQIGGIIAHEDYSMRLIHFVSHY